MVMKQVEISPVSHAYAKDNGLRVFSLEAFEAHIPFDVQQRSIVSLPPGQIGGNHSHPRAEAFIAMGEELELHWVDTEGGTHVERMNADSEFSLIVVHPHVPHAIINRATHSTATLLEYASSTQTPEDITQQNVIDS